MPSSLTRDLPKDKLIRNENRIRPKRQHKARIKSLNIDFIKNQYNYPEELNWINSVTNCVRVCHLTHQLFEFGKFRLVNSSQRNTWAPSWDSALFLKLHADIDSSPVLLNAFHNSVKKEIVKATQNTPHKLSKSSVELSKIGLGLARKRHLLPQLEALQTPLGPRP